MKLYFKALSISIKAQMEYKLSFFLTFLGQFLLGFTQFAAVYFLFDRFGEVEGYTFGEVAICFGVMMMSFHTAEFVFRGFDRFSTLIRTGSLDRILLRPRGVGYQVIYSLTDLTRLGRSIQGLIVLLFAIDASDISWTWDKALTLVLMVIGGTAVYAGLFMLSAGISFFTIEGLEIMNILTHGSMTIGQYPLGIYGKEILRFFTYVLPFALIQYYPFLYLSGRNDNIMLMFLPMAAFLFLLPCWAVWRFGLSHYKSTGS